jgi:iron(III) transport system substrate-binding protein
MKTSYRALSALLGASLLLAACAQAPAAEAPAPTAAAPAATEAPAPTTAPAAAPTEAAAASESSASGAGQLVVYSGRSESLVAPLIEMFKEQSGIDVEVRYGSTSEMAALILEEGENSPADVYYGQDAGALGALSKEGVLAPLPQATLDKVEERFRSSVGEWVGTSGRARVVVYNTSKLQESDLPASITGFTDPAWSGRIGWAPTNGSFQAFVTAFRAQAGEEATRLWLEGIKANQPKVYEGNAQVVQAVADGEIDVGFVNHYYLYQFLKDQGEAFPVRNFYPSEGDIGALINVAGAGIVKTAGNPEAAQQFVDYLLSQEAQQYFADETYEYPLIDGITTNELLKPLSDIETPELDLSTLEDLPGTLTLLQDTGVLE